MSASTAPIIVGIDGSAAGESALQWALDDAAAAKVPVRVICCHRRAATLGWDGMPAADVVQLTRATRDYAYAAVEKALEHASRVAPEVEVSAEAVDGRPVDVLTDLSAEAERVVVGSRHLKALGSALLGSTGAGVAARAKCPVVVVRGPAGLAAERAAVVVGIDGMDGTDHALQFGFEHAKRHGVPLRALMCWRPDPLATMQWRPDAPVPARAQAWLSEAADTWKQRYPAVASSAAVVRDHPVAGLVTASTAQHLLVVRSRTRNALAGTLLGSVTQGVLHHATCPVAVLPADMDRPAIRNA